MSGSKCLNQFWYVMDISENIELKTLGIALDTWKSLKMPGSKCLDQYWCIMAVTVNVGLKTLNIPIVHYWKPDLHVSRPAEILFS